VIQSGKILLKFMAALRACSMGPTRATARIRPRVDLGMALAQLAYFREFKAMPASTKRVVARPRHWMMLVCVLAAWGSICRAADQNLGDYKLHPGDHITVGVYDDPKMPPLDVTITPDGKFSFPLIGVMVASGKTVDQLRVEMETKLRKYVAEPIVTLIVTQLNGNVAYVIGAVNKPGSLVMNPTINVLQALSLAGGGNPYAHLDSIIVIRSSPTGQRVLNFRYSQVSAGKNLEQNVNLESGDVVVVP
jgi:polysaccharide export outer membrane protein